MQNLLNELKEVLKKENSLIVGSFIRSYINIFYISSINRTYSWNNQFKFEKSCLKNIRVKEVSYI